MIVKEIHPEVLRPQWICLMTVLKRVFGSFFATKQPNNENMCKTCMSDSVLPTRSLSRVAVFYDHDNVPQIQVLPHKNFHRKRIKVYHKFLRKKRLSLPEI